jgi:hypothetical protein
MWHPRQAVIPGRMCVCRGSWGGGWWILLPGFGHSVLTRHHWPISHDWSVFWSSGIEQEVRPEETYSGHQGNRSCQEKSKDTEGPCMFRSCY